MQADEERARNWRVTLGDFSDRIGSWVNTTTNTQIYDAQNRAKSSIPGIQPPAGQGFSNQIPIGNFTWKALSHPALGLNTLQKRQLMTLIGTVIYVPPASDQESPRLIVRPGHHKLLHYIGNAASGRGRRSSSTAASTATAMTSACRSSSTRRPSIRPSARSSRSGCARSRTTSSPGRRRPRRTSPS